MQKLWCRVGGLQLAILQPQKLLVCQLTSLISGQGIACMQLNILSQHALERSAANLVCGNFGGSQGAFGRHGVTACLCSCKQCRKQAQLPQESSSYVCSQWMVSLHSTKERHIRFLASCQIFCSLGPFATAQSWIASSHVPVLLTSNATSIGPWWLLKLLQRKLRVCFSHLAKPIACTHEY